MNPLAGPDRSHPPTALSVNLNVVAYVRNRRHLTMPSVTAAATACLQAGASGITVHPRPDERHIRTGDVDDLAALLRDWPAAEFNIEGNPFHNLLPIVRRVRPHQVTLVPDAHGQSTSDHGWNLTQDGPALRDMVAELKALGMRVSLFMDPNAQAMSMVQVLGADRVELYTEAYARAHGTPEQGRVVASYAQAARAAQAVGLGVNAGHDLSRANLPDFLREVPRVAEVSIGHALMAQALEQGYTAAVQDYLRCIHGVGMVLSPNP
jgi:pyridoxine 5-phosphate synthase